MPEYKTCPHPSESFEKEPALYSYRCPECKARVCLDCHRHGWKDALIPLVDWMTGTCDDCYRQRRDRQRVRDEFRTSENQRKALERVWDQARAAAPGTPNPHAELTWTEKTLLEQHAWLRDEVTT